MNKLILSGGLTKDSELKFTKSRTGILRFSLATKTGYGDYEYTEYTNCTIIGKRAEKLADSLKKGTQVIVEGEKKTTKHEDKYYTECHVRDIEFQKGGRKEEKKESEGEFDFGEFQTIKDDSIPF